MPDAPSIQRKLAAILAADAVGYSRLMARDEEDTLRVLSGHRTVIDGIIAFHSGRIVGTAGDSVLAEFASPVEALRCAVEIQEALKTRNAGVAEDRRMQFRIGINLGDVMVKGDDLLGDGVNVAARLESIAAPGGICISSSVYDQIAGKLDLGFLELGEKNLKNIDRPVRVYSVQPGRAGVRRAPHPRRARYPLAALLALAVVAAGWWRWIGPGAPSPAPVASSPAEIASRALQSRVTDLERHAAAAREDDERRLAAARSDAERSQEEARIAAVRAKAAEEIAQARSEAELAKARADAEAMRREAAAELAAARKPATPPAVAQPAIAQQGVPAPRSATVVGTKASISPPLSPASATSTPLAAARPQALAQPSAPPAWTATLHCDSVLARGGHDVMEEFTEAVPVRLDDGAFVVERRAAHRSGHLLVRGSPAAGRLVLTGTVIAPRGPTRGEELPVRLEGSLEAGRYRTRGDLGRRSCTIDLARASP